jgi:ferric-chelate reductase [NAD(P)H]
MNSDGALNDISYGVFVVTSAAEGKINGMIANSVFQVTAQPPKIAAAINKNSLSHEYILKSGRFCAQPLAEGTSLPFLGIFGFRTGRTFNKFEKVKYKLTQTGLPVVLENTLAALEVKVDQVIDLGTHSMFIGTLTDSEVLKDNIKPLTYDYYKCVLRGKTPRGATTFREDKEKKL